MNANAGDAVRYNHAGEAVASVKRIIWDLSDTLGDRGHLGQVRASTSI